MPEAARPAFDGLIARLRDLEDKIEAAKLRLTTAQKVDPIARRLATVPGLGPIASTAFAATTPGVGAFRSACDHAVWLGLTRGAHSSGDEERMGGIAVLNGYTALGIPVT